MRMDDTICALSTPSGMGAIAIIRLSGPEAFAIADKHFVAANKKQLSQQKANTLHFGRFVVGNELIDEVMTGVYRQPHSYTGEDVIEISCHGSTYIQHQIIRSLIGAGARLAEPGEYTMRAYANGKLDLSQAEAVADLIESESAAAHRVALQQMKGGISHEIKDLREQLIQFASLIELELDFGEEDVEFADRQQLRNLMDQIKAVVERLIDSFATGNVIKKGVPVAIVGAPNAGKSTLLNALLKEEKAIVTEVAGTTRDAIEDVINIEGIPFRFIDTAGIRETNDKVESIGISKTWEKIEQSQVVLYLFSVSHLLDQPEEVKTEIELIQQKSTGKHVILVGNKIDLRSKEQVKNKLNYQDLVLISALNNEGLDQITENLLEEVNLNLLHSSQSIITNERHLRALTDSLEDIEKIEQGLESGISGDFLAQDIRQALQHLGSIIGEVDVDQDILGAIFSRFCIGK